jgi:hypothetical protein
MPVLVEPPRPRGGARGPPPTREAPLPPVHLLAPEPVPPPPLWLLPSEMPPEARSHGFAEAYPSVGEPPAESEGLFDVPGLLERLWLARALEASHRERSGSFPSSSPRAPASASPAPLSTEPAGETDPAEPVTGVILPPAEPEAPPAVVAASPEPVEALPIPEGSPPAHPQPRPRGWICPSCYLTNDPGAVTCRGCRSGRLHL